MKKTCLLLSFLTLFSLVANAQAPVARRRPFVTSQGEATVSVQPDEARVQFSVVTQAISD